MPRYRITEKSYIDGKIVGPDTPFGEYIDTDAVPGPHFVLVGDEDEEIQKAEKASKGEKQKGK